MKKFILLTGILLIQSTLLSNVAYAADYVYVPGYGMIEVYSEEPQAPREVKNDGLFGMKAEDFRAMCEDTGGEWDIVSGRHICYCSGGGEFNYPYGCPAGGLQDAMLPVQEYYPDNTGDSYYGDPYYNDYYPPVTTVPFFYDLHGHWAEGYIYQLAMLGIIQGYPDGTFRPEQAVSRAEMLKMCMMAAGVMPVPGDEDRNRFYTDLDNWQAPWVNAAYRMDIADGYTGPYSGVRLFKPNNPVNRAEGVKMVLASFGKHPVNYDKITYIDVTGWMIGWVEDAYRMGLIGGEPNQRFYPGRNMTRAEAAKVIVKMLQYAGDI
ncbi:S-layer homology domain-containing protein [Candidatus Peregrinibacteria bacterium]|nr:S-layer homology domain-containing protein [Candidatus Peregrinibacteria bacterium]